MSPTLHTIVLLQYIYDYYASDEMFLKQMNLRELRVVRQELEMISNEAVICLNLVSGVTI